LVAIVSEFGSNGSNVLNLGNQFSSSGISRGPEYLPPELRNVIDWINQVDWNTALTYIGIALACLLIFGIVLSVFSIIGSGGLIGGILKADHEGAVTFREAWALGRRFFLRLLAVSVIEFLIRLVVALASFLIIFLPFLVFILNNYQPFLLPVTSILLIFPVYCCLFTAILLLSFYMYVAKLAIVVEDLGIGAALGRVPQVLKGSLGPILLVGVIVLPSGWEWGC